MQIENYLKSVRAQYESHPYPLRKPEDEKQRLITIEGENLAALNFYCYGAKRKNFSNFKVLIAGCGTGDSAIYMAEQLRDTAGAEVYALDISEASLSIAKARASIRSLNNINWLHESLLELPRLLSEKKIPEFDYINCSGVLHHLADPEAGLRSISSVLKPEGAMMIMLYAEYGRTGIYQMQKLMRFINQSETDINIMIDNTKKILASLPETNWYKRSSVAKDELENLGDVGLYDVFLHSQDRAYTIPQLYSFIERAGLCILDFALAQERMALNPGFHIQNQDLLHKIRGLDPMAQKAVAELISGEVTKHTVYAARHPIKPPTFREALDFVPFLSGLQDKDLHLKLAQAISSNPGKQVTIKDTSISFPFVPSKYAAHIFKYLDGNRTFKEIFNSVIGDLAEEELTEENLMHDFEAVYAVFRSVDKIFLGYCKN
jgi:2-polyprenyl-3-methyl-5-hydroxy-6-metoxy-1,4-benzoquinol methylase